jgi:DNA modification methylase
MPVKILVGDCRTRLRELPERSVQTCVTSPPYFGLRDYGMADQIGLEQTPDAFVAELVSVFREVKRVLRDDGTLWLNLGDSYSTHAAGKVADPMLKSTLNQGSKNTARESNRVASEVPTKVKQGGLPEKNLLMIPARCALALQADGWYLRQDIIWHKPNPMPEAVKDRCTKAHEYIFLLSKSARYYYDADAIAEPSEWFGKDERSGKGNIRYEGKRTEGDAAKNGQQSFVTLNETRNKRTVWTVPTSPYKGAHFATFPTALIEPCIKAGSKAGDVVLDPFGGAGTTGLVADRLGRDAILCELNPEYAKMAGERIASENPMFTKVLVDRTEPFPNTM